MTKPLFPKSVRKHIRLQKARIRREVFDTAKRQELIEKLLGGFLPKAKEEPASSAGVPTRHIAGSSNGRTAPSGGVYLGSNPSPAAKVGSIGET